MSPENTFLNALWQAATSPVRCLAEKRFAERARRTLQQQRYDPDVQPSSRRAPHGGGVSEATLRDSHNTPSSH